MIIRLGTSYVSVQFLSFMRLVVDATSVDTVCIRFSLTGLGHVARNGASCA